MSTRQMLTWLGWIFVGMAWLVATVINGATTVNTAIVEPSDFDDPMLWAEKEAVPWHIYPGIQEADSASYYRLIFNRDGAPEDQRWGHITVVYYSDPTVTSMAFEAIRREAEIGHQGITLDFSERGLQYPASAGWNGSDVLFVRCGTVVHLTMEDDVIQGLLAYARRLDQRIRERICKK